MRATARPTRLAPMSAINSDGEPTAINMASVASTPRKNTRRMRGRVAGYRTWQTLGRQVRKGERGIRIVVPYRMSIAPEEEGRRVESIAGWGARAVFDVSQTEGEPLVAPPINDALIGDATVADVVREELVAWLRERE